MAASPARRFVEHRLASQAATQPGAPRPATGQQGDEYRLMLVQLGEDLRALSNIQSLERKIEAKRTMLPRYADWVRGALAAEVPAQDEVVTTMLVWSIDLGLWDDACTLARHVLAHNLALPERYKRTPATLIAEEAAEAGLKRPPQIDIADLLAFGALTEDHDMADQARAKLHKALALAFAAEADGPGEGAEGDPDTATQRAGSAAMALAQGLHHATRALELDKGCGVKKLIEQLSARQKKLLAQGAAA